MKKLPQRTCIGCNTTKDKKNLIRIVKNNNDEFTIDNTGKKEGRGIYICKNIECIKKLKNNKKISKMFQKNNLEELYLNLEKLINGGEFIG